MRKPQSSVQRVHLITHIQPQRLCGYLIVKVPTLILARVISSIVQIIERMLIAISGLFPDLLATSGDYLRVWRAGEPETRLECVLNNNKNSDFCAPLTSFDWNEVDPNLIGTSSIDTTCTIWGLETGQVLGRVNMVSGHVKTQLIAHDKEVYDIAFSRAGGGRDMFASVGADGSVRMFDLRHLEHSTIIYEDPQHTPLLRLAWNKQDPNYLATVAMDACEVIILDVRVPCTPVARLNNHRYVRNLTLQLDILHTDVQSV